MLWVCMCVCVLLAVLYNRTIYTYKVVSQQQWSHSGCINLFSSTPKAENGFSLSPLVDITVCRILLISFVVNNACSLPPLSKVPKSTNFVWNHSFEVSSIDVMEQSKNAQCNNLNNELIWSRSLYLIVSNIASQYTTRNKVFHFTKKKETKTQQHNRRVHKYEAVQLKLINMCVFRLTPFAFFVVVGLWRQRWRLCWLSYA